MPSNFLYDSRKTLEPAIAQVGEAIAGRTSNPKLVRVVQFAAAQAWAKGDLEKAEKLYLSIPKAQRSAEVALRLEAIGMKLRGETFAEQLFADFDRDNCTATDAYRMLELARSRNNNMRISEFQELVSLKVQSQGSYTLQLFNELHAKDPEWRKAEIFSAYQPVDNEKIAWSEAKIHSLWRLRRFREVIETFEIELKSTDKAEIAFIVGECYRQIGDSASAKGFFAQVEVLLKGKKKNEGVVPLARKYANDIVALELIDSGYSLIKENNVKISLRAALLETLCRYAEAASEYAVLSQGDHKNSRLSYKVGLNAERSGNLQLALAAYDNALSQSKTKLGNWFSYRKARVLEELGNYTAAVEAYFDYLEEDGDLVETKNKYGYITELNTVVIERASYSLAEYGKRKLALNFGNPAEIRNLIGVLPKGNIEVRKELAKLLLIEGFEREAAEVLRHSEKFGDKDGLNPESFRRNKYNRQSTYYAEVISTIELNPRMILWETNHGSSLGCHPLAMFRDLVTRRLDSEYTHVWAVNDDNAIPVDVRSNPNVVIVKLHSEDYLFALATAKYLVNNVSFAPYFVRRCGQEYLNTWHGTPFKTLGKSMRQGILEHENLQRNFTLSTLIMAPNELTRWALIEDHDISSVYGGKTVVTGSPRLDTSINLTEERRDQIRSEIGVEDDSPVVLYAPTWRGGVSEQELNVEILLRDLTAMTASGIKVVFRAHRLSEKLLGNVELPVTVVPKHIDTNELLGAVDVLVTDYSSILFDFIPQGKPIIIYGYDMDQYSKERGLYLSAKELPGMLVTEHWQLPEAIIQALAGGGKPDASHLERFCPYEDGNAARRVNDLFFQGVLPHFGETRDYSDHNNGSPGKDVLVLHASLIPNGIASAFNALVSRMDSDQFDINIIVEPATLRANPDRYEQFLKLPDHVHVICRTVNLVRTIDEMDKVNRLAQLGEFPSEEFERVYRQAFVTERRRIFGDFVPSAAVEYDGYAEFWLALMSSWEHSSTVKSCYQHNQMFDEFVGKYPNLRTTFSLYRNFDNIVAVSPSLADRNTKDISTILPEIVDKQTSARNLVQADKIRRLADYDDAVSDVLVWMKQFDHCFVNVARMSMEKNQVALIKAIGDIRSTGRNIGLVLVGSGVLEGELRAMVTSLGLDDFILFTGQVQNPYPLIKASSAFVLPSKHEGQPVTLLEAMVLNRPVITSNLPGCLELVELGYGLICTTDTRSIKYSLVEFIEEPERAMGHFNAEEYEARALAEARSAIMSK